MSGVNILFENESISVWPLSKFFLGPIKFPVFSPDLKHFSQIP